MLFPANAVLRAIQIAVFAMALLLVELVNGSQARITVYNPAAIGADVRDLVFHDHSHHHNNGDDPAESGETRASADHGGTHHHIDANAVSLAAFVGPNAAPTRAEIEEPALIAWVVPPPQRPPPTPLPRF